MSRKPQQGASGEGIIPDICSLKQDQCFKSVLKSAAAVCGVREQVGRLSS